MRARALNSHPVHIHILPCLRVQYTFSQSMLRLCVPHLPASVCRARTSSLFSILLANHVGSEKSVPPFRFVRLIDNQDAVQSSNL